MFGIVFVQASLPDPFVITWVFAQSSFYGSGSAGYAFNNDVGYFFGRGFNDTQNSRYNYTDGTVISYPFFAGFDPPELQRPCVVPLPNGDIFIIGKIVILIYIHYLLQS